MSTAALLHDASSSQMGLIPVHQRAFLLLFVWQFVPGILFIRMTSRACIAIAISSMAATVGRRIHLGERLSGVRVCMLLVFGGAELG